MKDFDKTLDKMCNDLEDIKVSAIFIAEATKTNPEHGKSLNLAVVRISKLRRVFSSAAFSIQMETESE